MNKNRWLDGMMGVVVGDALGVPVQFMSREQICCRTRGPVVGMEGMGTYHQPAGTWSDDSSMALATLDSLLEKGKADPDDIMTKFIEWEHKGLYTPFGEPFDEGITCLDAISRYERDGDFSACGGTGERSNGNGSLMRILPACLYYSSLQKQNDLPKEDERLADEREVALEDNSAMTISECAPDETTRESISDDVALDGIQVIGGLTHNHLRSRICCGLYYFCVRSLLEVRSISAASRISEAGEKENLLKLLQQGMDQGFSYYRRNAENIGELKILSRLENLEAFKALDESQIRSSGYVVDSMEAAIWCLLNTTSLKECLLKAVNLGDDTDTVAAIAGGLAGLYYGYEEIPEEWLAVIQRREWLEEMFEKANVKFGL